MWFNGKQTLTLQKRNIQQTGQHASARGRSSCLIANKVSKHLFLLCYFNIVSSPLKFQPIIDTNLNQTFPTNSNLLSNS